MLLYSKSGVLYSKLAVARDVVWSHRRLMFTTLRIIQVIIINKLLFFSHKGLRSKVNYRPVLWESGALDDLGAHGLDKSKWKSIFIIHIDTIGNNIRK